MIKVASPTIIGDEFEYLKKAIIATDLSGSGKYNSKCQNWFDEFFKKGKSLTTSSCSHALDMSALIIDIQKGDEVIMASFNFVSAANSFALRGAKIIFIDISAEDFNINPNLIETAITNKTKAIVLTHYAGVPCNMSMIVEIAKKNNIIIIEDCAHSLGSKYNNKLIGSFGDISAFSFHSSKNLTSGGEGGMILINNKKYIEKAEIIREKGTNRSKFIRGEIDKYSWVGVGSSFLMNELSASFLYCQLSNFKEIQSNRVKLYNLYLKRLIPLKEEGFIKLQYIPNNCSHSAHIFSIILENSNQRLLIQKYLAKNNIQALSHYVPLHSSNTGKIFGIFNGKDYFTSKISNSLLRLPLHHSLKVSDVEHVCNVIKEFFK
tara:strand:- start:3225 stop:4355 length:1131 start_codon:yes stop_codon:yes gene_type:complete